MSDAAWLPPLVFLHESDGDWKRYCDATYAIFRRDFLESQPRCLGLAVACRRDPIEDGKEVGYWHCTSEGRDERTRTPALRRCERIAWVRAILENAHKPEVTSWENERHGGRNTLLWYREEFLIVLGHRGRRGHPPSYFQLITAYDTPHEHEKRRLRRERDTAPNG